MSNEVVTNVVLVTSNEISDEEAERIVEESDYDTLEEYAASLEAKVEALLATRTFGDADNIPILSVDTHVTEELTEQDLASMEQ